MVPCGPLATPPPLLATCETRGVRPNSPGDDDQHPLVQPAGVNIFDEGRHRLIVSRQAKLVGVEDVLIDGMIVPVLHSTAQRAVELGSDDLDPGFHQPAGHQALLAPLMSAVAIPDGVRFLLQIERLAGLCTQQQTHGLFLVLIDGIHIAGLIDVPPQPIQCVPHFHSLLQPARLGRVFQADVRNLELRLARVAEYLERLMGGAKIRRPSNGEAVVVVDRIDGDVVRQRRRTVIPHLVGDAHPVGIARHKFVRGVGIAGKHLQRSAWMTAARVGHRSQQRIPVGDAGHSRQKFANVDAGDIGVDRLKRPAIIRGRERLHIERVELTHSAAQPDENNGRALPGGRRGRLTQPHRLRQPQSREAVQAEP